MILIILCLTYLYVQITLNTFGFPLTLRLNPVQRLMKGEEFSRFPLLNYRRPIKNAMLKRYRYNINPMAHRHTVNVLSST